MAMFVKLAAKQCATAIWPKGIPTTLQPFLLSLTQITPSLRWLNQFTQIPKQTQKFLYVTKLDKTFFFCVLCFVKFFFFFFKCSKCPLFAFLLISSYPLLFSTSLYFPCPPFLSFPQKKKKKKMKNETIERKNM